MPLPIFPLRCVETNVLVASRRAVDQTLTPPVEPAHPKGGNGVHESPVVLLGREILVSMLRDVDQTTLAIDRIENITCDGCSEDRQLRVDAFERHRPTAQVPEPSSLASG